jgi:hypothetical protein
MKSGNITDAVFTKNDKYRLEKADRYGYADDFKRF